VQTVKDGLIRKLFCHSLQIPTMRSISDDALPTNFFVVTKTGENGTFQRIKIRVCFINLSLQRQAQSSRRTGIVLV